VINSLCKGRFLLQWLNFKCNEQPYRFIRMYKAELYKSPVSKYYICTLYSFVMYVFLHININMVTL